MPTPYLENHEIFLSKNLHEMQDLLVNLTSTDKVDVVGKGRDVDASLCLASFSDVSFFHASYGDVRTQVHNEDRDEDALLLFLMTGGSASVSHSGMNFDITPETGLMRNNRKPLTATQDGVSSFAIPLSADMLKGHLRSLIGDDVPIGTVSFDTKLDLTTAGGRHLRGTVHYIAEAVNGPLHNSDNAIATDGLRDLLLTTVLTSLPNTYSDLLRHGPKIVCAVPYYVKRARDFIHDNPGSSISLDVLARHAGCGYRTLQIGFNEYYGMSPMAYLRRVRLNLAREDLLTVDLSPSVRDVASKWGFSHMGAFSRAYRDQFGVLPSLTRRSRG